MTLWFRRVAGLDTDMMREIAETAGVSWSADTIIYRGNGIGYLGGDSSDATAIQDAAKSLLGHQLVVIDAPPEPDTE